MNYDTYKDRVYGCWLGKMIAGNIGGPLEDCREIMDFQSLHEIAPDEMMVNDDLDVQLIWLNVLLEKGWELTSDDLMEAFIAHYPYGPNEYGYGKRNYRRGIKPPLSGTYANEFFMHSMGCPIRAEIWASLFPFYPEKAVEYSYMDGCIDHGAESIYAEQYTAAIECLAFSFTELTVILEYGLTFIPEESRIAGVVRTCLTWYREGCTWKESVTELHDTYASNDSSISFYNFGVEILALLYGEGKFEETVLLAINGGYDTDCTAATVGAFLGAWKGTEAVPDEWKETIEDRIVTACVNLNTEFHTLSELTDTICSLGCLYDGGKKRIITNVPEKKDNIFFESGEKAAFITIDYEGLPEIGLHDSCVVLVAVKNNSKDEQYLEVAGREAFEICPEGDTKDIAPGECRRLRFLIKYREASPVVYDTNLFSCKVYGKNGSLQEEACFGLAGKPVWKVTGPFFNPYDFKKVSEEKRRAEEAYFKIPSRKIYRYYNLAEAHNNFVYLDEPYRKEDFSGEGFLDLYRKGRLYEAAEDTVRIDEMFGFGGCCCVYCAQQMYSEREETVQCHIGSTTPYKLWLNGELIYTQKNSNGYSPYTDVFKMDLKAGENRIVLKLLRYSEGQKFTMVMREAPYELAGRIKTDHAYGVWEEKADEAERG